MRIFYKIKNSRVEFHFYSKNNELIKIEKIDKLNGVLKTEVGYMGGITHNPTYNDVLKGNTNHAETVKITFDEKFISFEKILEYFFSIIILNSSTVL